MKTVWIYVDTNKQVGDVDHLKVFADPDAADEWIKENDPEGVAFGLRSWSRRGNDGRCANYLRGDLSPGGSPPLFCRLTCCARSLSAWLLLPAFVAYNALIRRRAGRPRHSRLPTMLAALVLLAF
jgi:hypothetical protein